jgi:hypothetical protein
MGQFLDEEKRDREPEELPTWDDRLAAERAGRSVARRVVILVTNRATRRASFFLDMRSQSLV